MSSAAPRRLCPACGSVAGEIVWRQDFALIVGVSIVDGYDVTICSLCGMAYADGIPAQSVFDRYYREGSKYEFPQRGGEESVHDGARLAITADAIARLITDRDCAVLDVGCATGRLLHELRVRGFTNLRGVDPSAACVAAARERYGVRADTGTIADLARSADRYDLIVLVGVLEHLVDLDMALSTLRSRLTPNGAIYVEVPDVTGFGELPNAPFQEFSVEHVNFFSPASLTSAMHRGGFQAEWVERNQREQSHRTVVSNLAGLFRIGAAATTPSTDDASRAAVTRYIALGTSEERELVARLESITATREPLVVWGTGTHTLRLLATTTLADAHIVAFVDSNARYHGRELCGRPVLAPAELSRRRERILITSRGFDREIRDQIQSQLGSAAMVISLH